MTGQEKQNDYVIRVLGSPTEVDSSAWNSLLETQKHAGPFVRHEYLSALETSKSADKRSGWESCFVTIWLDDELVAACPLYLKSHSYGEYVFDWAWANAYAQHGLEYYPKGVVAVPFTPVPGARLLAKDSETRELLIQALIAFCPEQELSSLHLLFIADEDLEACKAAGLMLRHTVQFHWKNRSVEGDSGTVDYESFDSFLASLNQEKRKKIKQERRKVAEAGVTFRTLRGNEITQADWDFFYSCYERTYLEHGNAPYLTRNFFKEMAAKMPENWLIFIAERAGHPIAASLIALNNPDEPKVAYGRYWGALERVDCLHFEACFYRPLEWCIANGYERFEGGAQGEHKMARALMPVKTTSAHWLAHPSFADAVEKFLEREGRGIENYMEHLDDRTPFKKAG